MKERVNIYTYPQETKSNRCHKYWTINILSQFTKLLLKIVMGRMEGEIEAGLDGVQSGFRQGKGPSEGLLNLRLVCERYLQLE